MSCSLLSLDIMMKEVTLGQNLVISVSIAARSGGSRQAA